MGAAVAAVADSCARAALAPGRRWACGWMDGVTEGALLEATARRGLRSCTSRPPHALLPARPPTYLPAFPPPPHRPAAGWASGCSTRSRGRTRPARSLWSCLCPAGRRVRRCSIRGTTWGCISPWSTSSRCDGGGWGGVGWWGTGAVWRCGGGGEVGVSLRVPARGSGAGVEGRWMSRLGAGSKGHPAVLPAIQRALARTPWPYRRLTPLLLLQRPARQGPRGGAPHHSPPPPPSCCCCVQGKDRVAVHKNNGSDVATGGYILDNEHGKTSQVGGVGWCGGKTSQVGGSRPPMPAVLTCWWAGTVAGAVGVMVGWGVGDRVWVCTRERE